MSSLASAWPSRRLRGTLCCCRALWRLNELGIHTKFGVSNVSDGLITAGVIATRSKLQFQGD